MFDLLFSEILFEEASFSKVSMNSEEQVFNILQIRER